MANAIAQTLLAKRTHKVAGGGKSGAMQHEQNSIILSFMAILFIESPRK